MQTHVHTHVRTSVHCEENIVGMFVIPAVLVLPSNDNGGPSCLSVLLQRHVQLEQILGILEGPETHGVWESCDAV